MSEASTSIPHYPVLKPEEAAVKQSAVERSVAKPDAFCKPCTIGKPAGRTGRGTPETRIRMANPNPKQRRKKRDPRAVRYY